MLHFELYWLALSTIKFGKLMKNTEWNFHYRMTKSYLMTFNQLDEELVKHDIILIKKKIIMLNFINKNRF